MFCSKCGSQNDENAKFCVKCGTALAVAAPQAASETAQDTFQQSQQSVQQTAIPQYQPKPEKKRNGARTALIIVPIAVLLVAIAAVSVTLIWINRPISKIERALADNDIESAAKLYGKLSKQEDVTTVKNSMLDVAEELKEDYLNGDKTYDEVMEVYDIIGEEILDNNRSFLNMKEIIEEVNVSRQNYDEAKELFESGEYQAAKEKYLLVIEDDLNFDKAQAAVEECDKQITGRIAGNWVCVYDVAWLFEDEWSYYGGDMSMPLSFYFTFNIDNTGNITCKIDDMDTWSQSIANYYRYYFRSTYYMSDEEINEYLEFMGYSSMEEWVQEDIQQYVYEVEGTDTVFEYSLDGDVITMVYDNGVEDICDVTFEDRKVILEFRTDSNELSDWGVGTTYILEKTDNAVL
jgi:uncharacterized protein YoxC